MKFLKLIFNECIKIFKRKSTLIFLIFVFASLLAAYGIMFSMKNAEETKYIRKPSPTFSQSFLDSYKAEYKNANEQRKKELEPKIELYEFAFENDIYVNDPFYNYKTKLISDLSKELEILNNIDENIMKDKFLKQEEKVNRIKQIIEKNDYYGYIKYQKDKIEYLYKEKQITEEDYKNQIIDINNIEKYRLDFSYEDFECWKRDLLERNKNVGYKLKDRIDIGKKEYIDDDTLKSLENEKLINLYRLDNNMPILYKNRILSDITTVNNYFGESSNSYYRCTYNTLAINISMFVITVLFIILASGIISEEISKGTIKFLMITPFKRYKILLAKLLALIVSLIIITLVLSQISTLLGNIFFNNAPNEYVYVENSVVKVLNTNIYEMFQFVLEIPEIIIYILFALTISTLIRNKIISNTITLVVYAASNYIMFSNSFGITTSEFGILNMKFMKYLPITNFNLSDKMLPTYKEIFDFAIINNSLNLSIIVLCITAFLLIITMFQSFRKKDI